MRIVINTLTDLLQSLTSLEIDKIRDQAVRFNSGDKLVIVITPDETVSFEIDRDYPHPGHDGDPS